MTIKQLIAESNRIEGIVRPPREKEIITFKWFMRLAKLDVSDLERFVSIYEPRATLRDGLRMDVTVKGYTPPPGGPGIRTELESLLRACNDLAKDLRAEFAWGVHISYEKLHPFMDCNGRSGRMLWYWMMRKDPSAQELGFRDAFYFQTLKRATL